MNKKNKKVVHPKPHIVKIQVEAKSPKRRKVIRAAPKQKPKVSIQKIQVEMQPVLVDNFVSLQKAMLNLASKLDSNNVKNERTMTNLAEKLENVSAKIERLLELFEISAKELAKRDFKLAGESNPEMMKKLNDLSDQNKIIARGLSMLHEAPGPAPMLPSPARSDIVEEEYKKSVSFKPFNPSE